MELREAIVLTDTEEKEDFETETRMELDLVLLLEVRVDDFLDVLIELVCGLFLVVATCVFVEATCLFVDLWTGCLNVFVSVMVEKIVFMISNCSTFISMTSMNSITFWFWMSSTTCFFFGIHLPVSCLCFFNSSKENFLKLADGMSKAKPFVLVILQFNGSRSRYQKEGNKE